jgi:phosphomannomutase
LGAVLDRIFTTAGEAFLGRYLDYVRAWADYHIENGLRITSADQCAAGMVLIAPGGQHMVFRNHGSDILARITPDPADDKNLTPLLELMKGDPFQFGAALDGDGDRVRFLDENAIPLDNGTILVLLPLGVIAGSIGRYLLFLNSSIAGAIGECL